VLAKVVLSGPPIELPKNPLMSEKLKHTDIPKAVLGRSDSLRSIDPDRGGNLAAIYIQLLRIIPAAGGLFQTTIDLNHDFSCTKRSNGVQDLP
jgi:hypothetical protein